MSQFITIPLEKWREWVLNDEALIRFGAYRKWASDRAKDFGDACRAKP